MLAWPDYYVPVLVLWWALYGVFQHQHVPLWLVVMVMLAFAGIAFGNAMSFLFGMPVGIIETLFVSHKAVAGAILFAVVCIMAWRLRWSWHPAWVARFMQVRSRLMRM